jgi:hypothetical protein
MDICFLLILLLKQLKATYKYCLQGGASKFLLTAATNSSEVFSKAIAITKQYLNAGGKGMPGLHLEGHGSILKKEELISWNIFIGQH